MRKLYGEHGKLGLFSEHKIVSEYAESIQTYSENTRKESMRTWRRHKETLGPVLAYSPDMPKDKKVCISRLIIIKILNFLGIFLSTL
jgi:hypothetical protein